MLFGDFFGELQREAIGVIELKSLLTTDLLGLGCQHIGQQLLAALQGFQKARFFALQLRQDQLTAFIELWVGRLHQGNGRLTHGHQKGLADAQQTPMAHHPAQQPPQDVAAAEVGGSHAITDQLRHRAAVITNHLQ